MRCDQYSASINLKLSSMYDYVKKIRFNRWKKISKIRINMAKCFLEMKKNDQHLSERVVA
jgi:hypothetical protein